MPPSEHNFERVLRSKAQAEETYDRISPWYDWLAARSERPAREVGLTMLAAGPGERILEVGFGTGAALLTLARAVGARGRVDGIEISGAMLRRASRRLAAAAMSDRVVLVRGDATRLPYEDAQFDAVFMSFVLDLIDTPEIFPFLGECHRVLKDDGRIVVVAMSNAGEPSWMSRLYRWAHRRLPTYVDCRPIPVGPLLAEAGFNIVSSRSLSMWSLPVEAVFGLKTEPSNLAAASAM